MFAKTLPPLLFAALATFLAGAASAQPQQRPQDILEFETVRSYALNLNEIGSGWALVSLYPPAFRIGLEAAPELEGAEAVFIKAGPGGNYAQGDLMQSVETDSLGGKRIRTTARIKNQGDGFAVFSLESFGQDGSVLATVHKKLALNTGWQPQELILDVPPAASRLEIGVSLSGSEGAAIWLDRVTLEVSGDPVKR
jgi:hypothetical protein